VAILELGAGEHKLLLQAARGLPQKHGAGTPLPPGAAWLKKAISEGKPVAIEDLRMHDPGEGTSGSLPDCSPTANPLKKCRALLAVPIIVQERPHGGILLYYERPHSFVTEEIELALTFGNQVGLALENARLREQAEQAATAAERSRLARDLHDAVTQTIFSASVIAESLPRIWERSPDQAQQGLEELRQLTRGALAEMRTLLTELRPATLTEKPLGELLRNLTEATTSSTRIPISLTIRGEGHLPDRVQMVFYRIAQEALNNVTKHASASEVRVDLRMGTDCVKLSIRDNGRGFDPSEDHPGHMGMQIMKERAESVGANVEIHSQPDKGAEVRVAWRKTSSTKV